MKSSSITLPSSRWTEAQTRPHRAPLSVESVDSSKHIGDNDENDDNASPRSPERVQ
ncbi:MAG: hypothetical protein K2L45_11630 [Muribaculaceae bacterium]|nr:hypothetical protein [Muribaculaceae bacterium]MDE6480905.1 hypothetical protein [Muribaculaceae bacterium]